MNALIQVTTDAVFLPKNVETGGGGGFRRNAGGGIHRVWGPVSQEGREGDSWVVPRVE